MKLIICFLSSLFVVQWITNAAAPEVVTSSDVNTFDAQKDFGPWIQHGKLASQGVNVNTGILFALVYKSDSSKYWITLSNDIGAVNEFLKAEIYTKDTTAAFLNQQLDRLLLATMGNHGGWIIDELRVRAYKAMNVPGDSFAVLKKYELASKPVIKGNKWTLKCNVADANGGIEHWDVSGQVNPLRIQLFSREIVEPDGAFSPYLQTY